MQNLKAAQTSRLRIGIFLRVMVCTVVCGKRSHQGPLMCCVLKALDPDHTWSRGIGIRVGGEVHVPPSFSSVTGLGHLGYQEVTQKFVNIQILREKRKLMWHFCLLQST